MITEQRRKDTVNIQFNARNLPRELKDRFKAWCEARKLSMQQAVRIFMDMAVDGDMEEVEIDRRCSNKS